MPVGGGRHDIYSNYQAQHGLRGYLFSIRAAVCILINTMKRVSFLAILGLLVVLVGVSCETSGNPDKPSAAPRAERFTGAGEDSAGQAEMKALAQAYPDRITELAFRGDDWAVRIDDTWYCWAHGRLLPEKFRHRWKDYASYRFYPYSPGLPPIAILDKQTKRRLKERLEQTATNPPERQEGFLADLYKAGTRGQTEAGIVTVNLMGFDVRVHEQVAEPLKRVGRALGILAETDPGVQRFVDGLKGLAGYNWREIAGTQSRSYHSYGIAMGPSL